MGMLIEFIGGPFNKQRTEVPDGLREVKFEYDDATVSYVIRWEPWTTKPVVLDSGFFPFDYCGEIVEASSSLTHQRR